MFSCLICQPTDDEEFSSSFT